MLLRTVGIIALQTISHKEETVLNVIFSSDKLFNDLKVKGDN